MIKNGKVQMTKPKVILALLRCLDIFVVCVVWGGGYFGGFPFDCVEEVRRRCQYFKFCAEFTLCYF